MANIQELAFPCHDWNWNHVPQCHLDIQWFLNHCMVHQFCLIPLESMAFGPSILRDSRFLHVSHYAGIFVLLQSRIRSLLSFSMYTLPWEQGMWYTMLDCFPRGNESVSLLVVNSDQRVLPVLQEANTHCYLPFSLHHPTHTWKKDASATDTWSVCSTLIIQFAFACSAPSPSAQTWQLTWFHTLHE